ASNTKCVYTKSIRGEGAKRQRQRLNGSDESPRQRNTENNDGVHLCDVAKAPESERGQWSTHSLKGQSKAPSVSGDSIVQQPPSEPGQVTTPSRSETDQILSSFVHDVFPQTDFSSPADNAAMEINIGDGSTGFGNERFNSILHEQCLTLENENESDRRISAKHPLGSQPSASGALSHNTIQPFEARNMGPPFFSSSPADSRFHSHMSLFQENPFADQGSPGSLLDVQKPPVPAFSVPANCKCLQEIGTLLSDLEHCRSQTTSVPLDYTLSYHKSALKQLSSLISCHMCRARPEFLVLLGVVCEKSTALCEAMLEQFSLESNPCPTTTQDRASTTKPRERFEATKAGLYETHKTAFLGDYEVNSPAEWHWLMKVLVGMQLSSLHNVLTTIKGMMTPLPNGAQHGTLLLSIEKRVRSLAARSISKGT
ncbi:MAG: hypothetical protein Q9191_003876, partial [Dirinaria sp. TL-2023a]